MIDLDKMVITLGPQTQQILRFDTWWAIPTMGIAVNLEEAKQLCASNNIPVNMVKPFTVAIGDGGMYEVMLC